MLAKKIIIDNKYIHLFGIRFLKGDYNSAQTLLENGGLMVVPSAPSLCPIANNPYYHQCLQRAKFAIPDSSLMVLLLKCLYNIRLKKLSGLAFLRIYINELVKQQDKKLFLVEPNKEEHLSNKAYLNQLGIQFDFYIAPLYEDNIIKDVALLEQLENFKPDSIIINLGGGIQEKLGYYLQENLSYTPAIICTGAAIAFLTGRQVSIPIWADRLYLGWLFRCLSNPKQFVPRYYASLKLIWMLIGCELKYE